MPIMIMHIIIIVMHGLQVATALYICMTLYMYESPRPRKFSHNKIPAGIALRAVYHYNYTCEAALETQF